MSRERVKLNNITITPLDNGYTVAVCRYNPYGANPSATNYYPSVGDVGSAVMLALIQEEKEIADEKLKPQED